MTVLPSTDRLTLVDGTVAYHTADGHSTALQKVSLQLPVGSWLAIVGANGSGKSTLAQVAAGLLPLSAGTISYSPDCVKAVVMQQPGQQLIGDTLREDLWFGLANAGIPAAMRPARIARALMRVGLEAKADRPVHQLSGGQQQLGAIAGCLALEATLLILDEPTSMLSAKARAEVLQTVRSLSDDGVSILWITHRMEELAYADRVMALVQGQCVFAGSVQAFFYGSEDEETALPAISPCAALGFSLPYIPNVVYGMAQRGVHLAQRPVTAEQLALAVAHKRQAHALTRER